MVSSRSTSVIDKNFKNKQMIKKKYSLKDNMNQFGKSSFKIASCNKINNFIISRGSWFDADLVLDEFENKTITGNRIAIKIKAWFQSYFYDLGLFIQKNPGLVLFIGTLIIITSSIGLKTINYENNIENLWIEEGGRVEKELNYIKKTLGSSLENTNQILIQTPVNKNVNILNPKSMLLHLDLMLLATQITVDLFGITWKLKDICYSLTPPDIEEYYITQTIEKMLPCLIITPLDCFWEGSKLLGPDDDIHIPGMGFMKWTNLNPKKLVTSLQNNDNIMLHSRTRYLTKSFMDIFKRGGIDCGYQNKQCLNPNDEECPNKNSSKTLDIGAVLTGGCYGFATKWMHWPEQLIIGASVKNKSGHIIKAESLQSIIQLMSDQNLYEFYKDHYKVISVDWTQDKAKLVLEAWQKKLSKEVQQFNLDDQPPKENNFHQFTSISLIEIMKNFNMINIQRITLSIIFVIMYFSVIFFSFKSSYKMHYITGLSGILVICFSISSGFGLCALLGLTFNANSMQIVPHLVFGIGIALMFWMYSTYNENLKLNFKKDVLIAKCLQQIGFSLFLNGLCVIIGFLSASIVPIPALRTFVFQSTILVVYCVLTVLLLIPAILTFDLRNQKLDQTNFLCDLFLENKIIMKKFFNESKNFLSNQQNLEIDKNNEKSINQSFKKKFVDFLFYQPVKILCILIYLLFTISCLYGCTKLKDALDLTDIVPKNTDEYQFLNSQKQYYNVYHMFLITKGNFDYPNNQKLLYEYHRAFNRVNNIVKNDNGGLQDFWLILFRQWLKSLQTTFDEEYRSKCITDEGWFQNASSDAILAFKLMSQTGRLDNPISRKILSKKRKLVDDNDIINPKAFYNYLTAWVSSDALTYSASHAVFKPEPVQWVHDASNYDLKIPKAQPLVYTQIPFLLSGLDSTETILKTIEEIRYICSKFSEKGLNSFPTGLPFVFWEQYVKLRIFLYSGLLLSIAITFIFCTLFLFNIWATVLILFTTLAVQVQLFGLMGHLSIRLNAVPTVISIFSSGITACNLIHFMVVYLSCMGKNNQRLYLTIKCVFGPILNGLISFILSTVMLSLSEFNYISTYFFFVFLIVLLLNLIHLVILFPLIISLIGPSSEIKLVKDEDFLKLNFSVILSDKKKRNLNLSQVRCENCCKHSNNCNFEKEDNLDEHFRTKKNSCFRKVYPRINTAISLSTISEESQSLASFKEIMIQSELVFETT